MSKNRYPKIFEIISLKALSELIGRSKGYFDSLNTKSKDNAEKIEAAGKKFSEGLEIAKTIGRKPKQS